MEIKVDSPNTPAPHPLLAPISREIPQNEASEIWEATIRILEQNVVSNQLSAWIRPLKLIRIEQRPESALVVVAAENDFSAQWVRDRFKEIMESSLTQVLGTRAELRFETVEIDPENAVPFEAPVVYQEASPASENKTNGVAATKHSRAKHESHLDHRYTFDSFVVGASNQFAYASAIAVAEAPAKQYNPLFIYAPPGLGKTHILYAIGTHMLKRNPNARIVYLSAESFVNELIDSLQHHRMQQFRTKYRDSFDIILMDDIQFIAEKPKSEEEFFHTFNALYSSKRQIVVTSDRPPKEIKGLEERVRTRFEWGLIADIKPPEIETRIAILKSKAERDDVYLPDNVTTFIATHVKTNIRELEGVLIRLEAQASLTGAEISLEMAKQELKTSIPEEGSHLTVESIQTAVCKHFNLKPQDLRSSTRAKAVALPRQIAMHLIRKYTGLGYKEIGQYFGGKDHTTILHACKKVEEAFDTDSEIHEAVEAIQNLL